MPAGKTARWEWGWDETGPLWGARAFAPKSGQDHLGLGSVSSDRILPSLSPGINVLTIHPRYWSFYSWVLDEFWATKLPPTRQAFRDFYRPREALFSMACQVCDAPEHDTLVANIVGSRRVSPRAQDQSFNPQFDYIKEPLGGYGLYYRTTMEVTGVLVVASPANGFPFDAPTPFGQALAQAYREAVGGTRLAARLQQGDVTSPVPRDVLLEFARKACLCQLRRAESHDMPLLQDLFLHSGRPQDVAARSQTMRMLLDLSRVCPAKAIGEDEFRQLVYFRKVEGSQYEPQQELLDVARRWRVYQGREYFAYVFNRLLRWVSRRGLAATEGGLTLLPKTKLWDLVEQALNHSENDPDMGLELPNVRATTPVPDLERYLIDRVDVHGAADKVWDPHVTLDEHALYGACRSFDNDDGRTLLALIAMILLLYQRFGLPKRMDEFWKEEGMLVEGGALRIGMARFMNLLNQRLLRGPDLGELARWLIEDFVIVQHERVATAKLPDDTFRVRRVGDDLRFSPQWVGTDFNDSRFNALSTMVHELGWVSSFREPHRLLTASGEALLSKGDLPGGALHEAAARFEAHRTSS